MKKLIVLLLALAVFTGCSAGCGKTKKSSEKETFNYIDIHGDLTDAQKATVSSLYYKNNDNTDGADPACLYCEKDGYYYLYSTGSYDIMTYRSRNLNDWEYLGKSFYTTKYINWATWTIDPYVFYDNYKDVINPFTNQPLTEEEFNEYFDNTWISEGYIWAPAVVYDAEHDWYLMYFTAKYSSEKFSERYPDEQEELPLQIALAVSKTPFGPYLPWRGTVQGGTYANGQTFESYDITYETPFIDFERLNGVDSNYPYEGYIKVIDVETFVDPATGDKYLYFVRDLGGKYQKSGIMGMKMIDWFTPDYSTLTLLTVAGKINVSDGQTMADNDEGSVNEGPYCVYNPNTGKYILTFSCNNYVERTYRVKQAIADSPLGPFTKMDQANGGWVISAEPNWPHKSGTGHHCFVTVGDEMFIVYHMHKDAPNYWDPGEWGGPRVIGVDKMYWATNSNGQEVLFCDGPSMDYTLCPQTFNGGYYNVADRATITASAENENVALINDGLVKYHAKGIAEDYYVTADSLTVTLDFASPVSAKSILVYNAFNIRYAFENIASIEICYKNQSGADKTANIGEISFDWNMAYTNNINTQTSKKVYVCGCASGVIFDELSNIYKITVTLAKQDRNKETGTKVNQVGLSEIMVIGKV